ncbi:hypothetical protein A9Q74_04285 [Colwellia sp. 39_35_sub15_T18]|nr:hypothetical protein A9Q74_04285 [Colwellia sp. 39_35_sub15_T18]
MSNILLAELSNMPANSKSTVMLKEYLSKLLKEGWKLPEGNSKEGVDITALTNSAGLGRQAFYPDRGAAETITMYQWAVKKIGIETIIEREERALNSDTTDAEILKTMLKESERKLGDKGKEVLKLQAHNRNLVKQLKKRNDEIEQMNSVNTARLDGYEVIIPWINE